MINWIRFDPGNPPVPGLYLAAWRYTDGQPDRRGNIHAYNVAVWNGEEWELWLDNPEHYAHINYPEDSP